jgi:hypothetical protein
MLKIISADMSLDKEAFKKVQSELESKLIKILIPTGRTFINFSFEEQPNYDLLKKEVDESEEDYPYVCYNMVATYGMQKISNLYDEFSTLISETRFSSVQVQGCPLQSTPAYTKFTTLLGQEIEKILNGSKTFLNNKWTSFAMVEVEFNNPEGDYSEELIIKLLVCVK